MIATAAERRREKKEEFSRAEVGEMVQGRESGGVIQWNSPAVLDSVTANPIKRPIRINQQRHEEGLLRR
jgi:hypothetical protein